MSNNEFRKTSNDVNEKLKDALMEALSDVDMSKFDEDDDDEDDDESEIETEAVVPSEEKTSEVSQKIQDDDASSQKSASAPDSETTSYDSVFRLIALRATFFIIPIVIILITMSLLMTVLFNISRMEIASSDEDTHIQAVQENSKQNTVTQSENEEISGKLVASSTGHYIEYVDKNMVQFVLQSDDGIEYRVQTCLHTRFTPHEISKGVRKIEKNNGCAFYQISEKEEPHAVVFVERDTSDETISIFADIYIHDDDMTYLTALSENSDSLSKEPKYPAAIEELSSSEEDVRG